MEKKVPKVGLKSTRKELEILYKNTSFKALREIESIAKKAADKDKGHIKFSNLLRLVADEGILFQAIGNISGKKGALTKGPTLDQRTVDSTSIELVKEISKQLKSGKYRFKPIRRIYMDKSGKNPVSEEQQNKLIQLHSQGAVSMQQIKELKARPLGISSFPDKVVQESIRMVLNAIYEPEFARQNVNYGFRPSYGCADAINSIKSYAKAMDYAIEGDIKGAFDNVNHDILIEILKKRIDDNRLLNLIKGGLKCGVMFLNYRQDSDLGTVQGSVVSPLLYNIYFNEFDKFINTEFKNIIEQINKKEKRTNKPINKLYNSISKKKSLLNLKYKIEMVNKHYLDPNYDKEALKREQANLKKVKDEYKVLDKQQKMLPAYSKSRQTIRYTYHRYADDWVLFTNAELKRVLEWKQLFTEWIQSNLKLELSPEKTKIANLRKNELVKFLGYQLIRESKRKNLIKVGLIKKVRKDIARRNKVIKIKIEQPKRVFTTRGFNPTLIVSWDRERVLNRLFQNGFIVKYGNTYRGKSKLPWTVLRENEIIERYNYMIRGYLDYYTPVSDYPTGIQFLYYLLKYSCAHTLAQKYRTSIRAIFKKFGKDLKISYIEKISTRDDKGLEVVTENKKTIALFNWKDCLDIIRKCLISTRTKQKNKPKDSIAIINKAVDEICNVKVNWRTLYKLTKYCAICGCTQQIEYHHVKHIRKGKVTGFLQLMNQLNRKQIPVCKECHKKIHKGLYDDLPLNQIYDEQLIIL